ncbi:hypothetical protein BJ912DRAFT_1139959, partial [Pholiota molesta]
MFGRIPFVQPALIGRRTWVLHATAVEGDSGEWESVIKFSFLPVTEISRGEMLPDTTNCARDAKGTWTDKRNIQYRLAEYFPNTETAGKRIEYEKRTLKVLVITKLYPIKDLNTADKLVPVVKDIFKCYKWLHTTAGVIHPDISETNLMYWKKPDRPFCGVLSDYDLSWSIKLDRQDRGPSSKQRTGTGPFMAIDLLDPTPRKRLYRHDLESLFYVIIVLMFRSQGKTLTGEDKKFDSFPALKDWFMLAPAQLLREKKAFFQSSL